jgi:hypothetical protein
MIILPEDVTLRYRLLANRGHQARFAETEFLPYAGTVPDGGRQGCQR